MNNFLKITEDDILNEIENLRLECNDTKRPPLLTEIQFKAIRAAREGNPPIPWLALASWWANKGWDKISERILQYRYQEECVKRGLGYRAGRHVPEVVR